MSSMSNDVGQIQMAGIFVHSQYSVEWPVEEMPWKLKDVII
jgi:hypothetical protein